MAVVDALPEALWTLCLDYLSGSDLGQLSIASKFCCEQLASEAQWLRAVRERFFKDAWNPHRNKKRQSLTPRMCGAANWARAYRELDRRIAAPRTWLTPRHARIFARGRTGHCGAWCTLSHSSDCRTRQGQIVEIRVLIQNLGATFVAVRPQELVVRWLCCREVDAIETKPASIVDTKVIARSRDISNEERSDEYIEPYDWIAVALRVECPECAFELDFLERAVDVTLPFVEANRKNESGYVARVLEAPCVSTETLYKWYAVLPGGYVSLAQAM